MDNSLTIKERIIEYLRIRGIRKIDFFEAIDVQPSNFKGKNMKSQPGGDMIVKILTSYPDISPDWLLLGVGEMLRSAPMPTPQKETHDSGMLEKLLTQAKEIGALEMRVKQLEAQLAAAEQQLAAANIKNDGTHHHAPLLVEAAP